MGIFGSTKNDARPAHAEFGNDYSRFLRMPAQPDDPFPNPANDGQRVINARSRAAKAGVRIQSGYLNPKTGILEDPDRGFGRWMGNHPGVMAGAVIGGGLGAGMLMGPAAAAPVAAPTGVGTGAGTQLGVTAGSPIGSSLFGGTVAPVATTGAATTTPVAMSGLSPVAANLFGPPAASPFVRTAVNTLANTGGGGGGGGNPFSGMGLLDIAKLGQQAIGQYLAYHASQGASEAQLSAAREALEFAKKAYEEQNAKEQARFEATEARRAPFREGALKAHMELRRIIGL